MDSKTAERLLDGGGLKVTSRTRTKDNFADRLECASGEIVNVYDSGKVTVQGKNQDRLREILGLDQSNQQTVAVPASEESRRVFVVYGHDHAARTELEATLRRWNIEPLILDQLPSEGMTLIEKLEKYSSEDVRYAIVLATPDDEGHARGKIDENRFRARQNVVLELGMMLAKPKTIEAELRQILDDLGLAGTIRVEKS
jgi:predicted nucleotide-binding protein